MLISVLLLISLSLSGCMDNPMLPPKPNGLHCTYSKQFKKFYCNEINNPEIEKEFTIESDEIDRAQCMPLETFEKYEAYVQEIKDIANRECLKKP